MKCSPARMRRAVSFWPRKPPPGPAAATAAPPRVASETSTGALRRRSMPAISLSMTDCGSDIVLCESISPQPVTMSGPAAHTVAAFMAFS